MFQGLVQWKSSGGGGNPPKTLILKTLNSADLKCFQLFSSSVEPDPWIHPLNPDATTSRKTGSAHSAKHLQSGTVFTR